MCLDTKWRFPRISFKPIIVYKVLQKNNMSPYYDFDYTPYIDSKTVCKDNIRVEKDRKGGHTCINGGYIHAYQNVTSAKALHFHKVIHKCIIPPFTRYYKSISAFNTICSKRIKFIKIV